MSQIKSGTRCIVARNTTRDECRALCIGRHVITVTSRCSLRTEERMGFLRIVRDVPAWHYAEPTKLCPRTGHRCDAMSCFPEDDLDPLPPEHDCLDDETPVDIVLPLEPVTT